MSQLIEICTKLMERALALGADEAASSAAQTTGLEASVRDGALEGVGQSETQDIGVRVIVGRRQACVSASSWKDETLEELAGRAVAMAREAPEDPWCGLPDTCANSDQLAELELHDPSVADPDALRDSALELDAITRSVAGVTKTESTGARWRRNAIALVQSNGFSASRKGSFWSADSVAIAGEGLGMERDYDFSVARWRGDMRALSEIGQEAGARAIRRLDPRKPPTKAVPIIFEQRCAASVIGHFLGAINGASVARGSTYLRDKLGERIFAEGIAISDDPLRPRGIASRPNDGEGLASRKRELVADGVLQGWLLDSATARQLGMESSASASFAIGSAPRPNASNVTISAGSRSPEEMIGSLKEGLLVTELIGASISPTTGDYSRGATGFWIENGEIAYPVSEATVVGNLLEMFARLEPANDLPLNRALTVPTLLIDGCNVAGS